MERKNEGGSDKGIERVQKDGGKKEAGEGEVREEE